MVADVDAKGKIIKYSGLHWAVSLGNVDIADLLLERVVNTELEDRWRQTPSMLLLGIFSHSDKYIKMMKLFLERGVSFNIKDYLKRYSTDLKSVFGCGMKIPLIMHTNHFINNNQSLKIRIHDILLKDKECSGYFNEESKFELPLDCTLEQFKDLMNYIMDFSVLSADFESQDYLNDLKVVFDSLSLMDENSNYIVQSIRNSNHGVTTFLLDYQEGLYDINLNLGKRIVKNEELFNDFYKYFTCKKEKNVKNEMFTRLVIGIKHAIHCTIKDIDDKLKNGNLKEEEREKLLNKKSEIEERSMKRKEMEEYTEYTNSREVPDVVEYGCEGKVEGVRKG